ncbi:bleomycin hydrolase-like [Sycon ciliatum]|uniref:bleomycin hydrolase-like n=1 Tax=Sycon ciliatum TaxID=27933 RepID=UPI0031F67A72|eukprot:scpid51241/ scgid35077/ Bleomycin hydrolase
MSACRFILFAPVAACAPGHSVARVIAGAPSSVTALRTFSSTSGRSCDKSPTSSSSMSTPVSREQVERLRAEFDSCPKNKLAQNSVTKAGINDACLSRTTLQTTNRAFSCRLPNIKPVTNQKASGRCWIFAAMNAVRQVIAKEYNMDKFELSQSYLYFWDKVERANYGLETIIGLIERGEDDLDGRVFSFVLNSPLDDGGQWDMISALIAKHGIVPKSCMPDAHSASNSRIFGRLITRKMRQFARDLQKLYAEEKSVEALRKAKEEMVATIYRMCCISLGTPPTQLTWEYTDKDNTYHCHQDITPVQLYEKFVKPHFDVDNKVCLMHDPRPGHPYHDSYTVQYLGSVVGGRSIQYVNLPMDEMKEAVRKSLIDKEAVWFGCDHSKGFDRTTGFLDLTLFDYDIAFDTDLKSMDKSERIRFGDSIPGHAMMISGFNVPTPAGQTVEEANASGKINKWCIENSWGDAMDDKGYLTATDDWFAEYVFMAVVDKRCLGADAIAALDKPVHVLPPWDPMGTLA